VAVSDCVACRPNSVGFFETYKWRPRGQVDFSLEIAGKPGRSSIEPKMDLGRPKIKSTLQPPASPKSPL